jgi:hypothetical protein
MKSEDYTLPFFKKCLSQHIWDWRNRFVTTAVVRHHEANEETLKRVAHDRGGEFLEAYNACSPQTILRFTGIPAPESTNTDTPNTTPPMKIEINIPDELFNPLVQAIDRLTEAVKAGGIILPRYAGPSTGTNDPVPLGTSDTATTTVVEAAPDPAEKPKAGRPKKEKPAPTESAPIVEATVEPVVEPVVETVAAPAAAPVPTGPELSEKVGPLAAHPALQAELIAYKKEVLGIAQPIRTVTDTELLRQFNAKVDELLGKMAAEV